MSEQVATDILHRTQNNSRVATPSSPQSNTSLGRRLVTVGDKVDPVCSVTRSLSLVVWVLVQNDTLSCSVKTVAMVKGI